MGSINDYNKQFADICMYLCSAQINVNLFGRYHTYQKVCLVIILLQIDLDHKGCLYYFYNKLDGDF